MKLYFSPAACSLAAHIALREAGIDFELVRVVGRGDKTAGGVDYATITSKGYVPALALDNGEVLTEGTAILPYIADLKPDSKLAPPAGTLPRYRLHEWLGYINSEIHKNFSAFYTPGATDEQKAMATNNLNRRFALAEETLANRPFLLGDAFTVADAYLFTVLGWARFTNYDLGRFPNLLAYQARIAARPSVQESLKAEGVNK